MPPGLGMQRQRPLPVPSCRIKMVLGDLVGFVCTAASGSVEAVRFLLGAPVGTQLLCMSSEDSEEATTSKQADGPALTTPRIG